MSVDDWAVLLGFLIAMVGIGLGLRKSLSRGAVPLRRSPTDEEVQATRGYAWVLFAVTGLICGGLCVWIIAAN